MFDLCLKLVALWALMGWFLNYLEEQNQQHKGTEGYDVTTKVTNEMGLVHYCILLPQ